MDIYVARQPIFDEDQKVYGYELLFRSGLNNFFDSTSQDAATTKVIDNSFLAMGIKNLTGEKRALINFTGELLKQEIPTLFPKELIGIEILETVKVDDAIISACKKLNDLGYTLFLDDFVLTEDMLPLIELAHVIKVDFLGTSPEERREWVEIFGREYDVKFLAERIETFSALEEAIDMGYSYFQGYFFCKPHIVVGREIPGYRLTSLRIIREINSEDSTFESIAEIVRTDLSLSYKVLKLVNSAAFGLTNRVDSIKQALVILGLNGTKKLINLICLNNLGLDKPSELMINSLFRARFGELLAKELDLKGEESQIFMLGLFSAINAFLDRSMEEIMKELPIQEEVKRALLGEKNKYASILSFILAYEKGDWERVKELNRILCVKEDRVPPLFQTSVLWAQQLFHSFS